MKKGFVAAVAVLGVLASTALVVQSTNAFGLGFGMGSKHGLDAQAEILGMETDELAAALDDQTFGDILKEQDMTKEAFETALQERAIERMRERGLTEEEIADRLSQHEERMNARVESLAGLMGIDTATLESELENSTLPELLDKYEVSHVELHNARQTLGDEHERGMGPGGFGHMR